MDFNQTARDTLTRVQTELAQGKNEISWTVYDPIIDLDGYRKQVRKQHGWRAYCMTAMTTFLLAFMLIGVGSKVFGTIGGSIGAVISVAVAVWSVRKNGKDRQKELSKENIEYRICVNFAKRRFVVVTDGISSKDMKFNDKKWALPAFNLPENATPKETAQRDTLQNALIQQMSVRFVEYKVW
ncbi:hypothetical protein [Eikenella longinqua]|uniref:hypothetical protein n=1 Tax=Eikenella longinqua TaxID=1795827 RepID=UPI000B1EBD6A|nr:hypothetical protein [Eikenella longinqua]